MDNMKVVVNRSGGSLKIPEINREIPWDGKRYIIHKTLVDKYRGYLEVVDVQKEDQIIQMQQQVDFLIKKIYDTSVVKDNALKLLKFVSNNIDIPKIDFLYSFHFDEGRDEAIKRLRCSIQSIRHQNVRICICDTSKKSMKSKLKGLGDINYYHQPLNLEVYCKPMTINLGVEKLVKSDYFFLSDIDLYYHHDFVRSMGMIWVNNIDYVRVIFFNNNMGPGQFPISIDSCKSLFKSSKDLLRTNRGIAPGNGLVHRRSFDLVGGFDERYVGYGPEDADFNIRIRQVCKYIEIDLENFNSYHMNHGNDTTKELYSQNLNLYERVKESVQNSNNNKIIRSGDVE